MASRMLVLIYLFGFILYDSVIRLLVGILDRSFQIRRPLIMSEEMYLRVEKFINWYYES
jgi:uncharacterized protein YybS (DUF2232 family)